MKIPAKATKAEQQRIKNRPTFVEVPANIVDPRD